MKELKMWAFFFLAREYDSNKKQQRMQLLFLLQRSFRKKLLHNLFCYCAVLRTLEHPMFAKFIFQGAKPSKKSFG